ncbi:sterol desaturase family protein [Pseudomonas trivialis]|uniref:Sterol desaturase/sphingolipid hydroxylase, fatty acid hydroxylase superfamily n=1 Tax=Pseudomonas trivialis TaxID=200450 RepID=A0ABY0UKJ9_9PSED|nr:sterol desaturase family protein [Pseudomonas trivialis]SDS82582.1 Sterol desaturase/sphingolipid hydroxylase, fatty acid hydroxylase superfamily [Pseudomonas trivialis]
MTMHNVWESIVAFYEPTIEIMSLWAFGLPLFVTVIAVMFIFSQKWQGPLTLRALINAAFPREQYDHASSRVDRWNGIILLMLGFPLVGVIAINGIAIADNAGAYLNAEFGAQEPVITTSWLMVSVQFLVYFLSVDFVGYWVHRWCHTHALLWHLHKPHHTAETLTPWTLFRQHPIEFFGLNIIPAIFGGAFTGVVLYATGSQIHPGMVAAVTTTAYIAFFVIDVFSHVHMPISYGWLNRIILAPVMHNLHHSMEPHHWDKNNAVILTLWDWMFGTLYLPKQGETWRWGCNDEEYGANNPHKTLKGFYIDPFKTFWRHLKEGESPNP